MDTGIERTDGTLHCVSLERARKERGVHEIDETRGASQLSVCESAGKTHVSDSFPSPDPDERPAAYADRVGAWYVARKSDAHRKSHGLYLTPVAVAEFMAKRIHASGERLRLLDPAAGAGILACAAVEELASKPVKPKFIELVACEIDEELIPPLQAVLDHLAEWCRRERYMAVDIRIQAKDFVLANAEALNLMGGLIPFHGIDRRFDIVVSNPPYFKIGKADPRAAAAAGVVRGQPNIYGIFMAVGAAILKPGGNFIFIVPRSFASGPYFRQFRSVFFDMIRPVEVHVFGSRREAFSRDDVLQENIIFSGLREDHWHAGGNQRQVLISSSRGVRDMGERDRRRLSMPVALDVKSAERIFRMPLTNEDDAALELVHSWPSNLHALGLNISTGPVVAFRASGLIRGEGDVPASDVPMLWMNHVRPMSVTWPLNRHKPEYIRRSGAEGLLVVTGNHVLLRRFSAKEEARRLTAAPFVGANFDIPEVGLENHLNYVHRPGGFLSEDEAWGLAALYNSRLLDTYFRAVNGNTQVSATELRAMPLPARETVLELGRRARIMPDPMEGIDDLVMSLAAPAEVREATVG